MKSAFLVLLLLALTGCATIDNAGHSAYSATAVKDAAGKVVGYDFAVKDGKEYSARQIQFQAKGDSVTITIVEGESKAFRGQGIAAKALTVLPVTGLTDLLK